VVTPRKKPVTNKVIDLRENDATTNDDNNTPPPAPVIIAASMGSCTTTIAPPPQNALLLEDRLMNRVEQLFNSFDTRLLKMEEVNQQTRLAVESSTKVRFSDGFENNQPKSTAAVNQPSVPLYNQHHQPSIQLELQQSQQQTISTALGQSQAMAYYPRNDIQPPTNGNARAYHDYVLSVEQSRREQRRREEDNNDHEYRMQRDRHRYRIQLEELAIMRSQNNELYSAYRNVD
jgi:hypothetical protein